MLWVMQPSRAVRRRVREDGGSKSHGLAGPVPQYLATATSPREAVAAGQVNECSPGAKSSPSNALIGEVQATAPVSAEALVLLQGTIPHVCKRDDSGAPHAEQPTLPPSSTA